MRRTLIGLILALRLLDAGAVEAREISIAGIVIEPCPGALAAEENFREASDWLEKQIPNSSVSFEKIERPATVWGSGSQSEIEKIRREFWKPSTPNESRILVVYAPRFAHGSLGRAWAYSDGSGLIVMNTARIANHARDTGMLAREERTLRHELMHAVGFIPAEDHLARINGLHCKSVNCLLHAKIRFFDLLSHVLPDAFARKQPRELCALCRRDLEKSAPR